jgi:hypothetical protein
MAGWELVSPKLWRSVCGVGARGESADPRSVRISGRVGAASMRMCTERRTSPGGAVRYFGGCLGVSIAKVVACSVCGVWGWGARAPTQDPLDASRYGCIGGTIARSIASRHVGITSRVKAGWRRAANRVRVGAAAAAAAIERQLNGFMGSWAGAGSTSRSPKCTNTS